MQRTNLEECDIVWSWGHQLGKVGYCFQATEIATHLEEGDIILERQTGEGQLTEPDQLHEYE